MIKRTLYFGNPAYLSLKDNQLVVRLPDDEQKGQRRTIPLEDIGVIVLDNQQVTITQGVMSAMLRNNVAIITCDAAHMPCGMMMNLDGNVLQKLRLRQQLDASEPLKKQLWAQVVAQKIRNQASILEKVGFSTGPLNFLARDVKSGDTDNREATAAAYYWSQVFSKVQPNFKRERNGVSPNNLLNYAYAIVRATMARSLVSAGLLPTLGIFHANKYNAYCLADDIMEPYRPLADLVVIKLITEHGLIEEMGTLHKAEILKLPVLDVLINNEMSPMMTASHRTAQSLAKCFSGEARKLALPEIVN